MTLLQRDQAAGDGDFQSRVRCSMLYHAHYVLTTAPTDTAAGFARSVMGNPTTWTSVFSFAVAAINLKTGSGDPDDPMSSDADLESAVGYAWADLQPPEPPAVP